MTNLIARVLSVVSVSTLLLACGAEPLVSEQGDTLDGDLEPIDRLERDLGQEGVMDLLQSGQHGEISALLQHYDIGYEVETKAWTDCNKTFPSADRNKWHNVDGEHYYVEGNGRPSRAYKDLPPIAAAPRSDSCQASVGQWGDAENPNNDYDGGHMIGSQLGGYGRRLNLVPQDLNFNRGNWAALENKMAKCGGLPANRVRYYITVGYPNGGAVIPNSFGMQLTNQSSGSGVSLSFSNTDGGGSNGTSEKNRGVTFLTNQGCN